MYILVLILSLSGTIFCQTSNVWNGITPLKSTRADVEKILGKPVPLSVARHAAGYKTKDGRVFVLYSTGLCDVNPEHGWNIPELTVIKISYYPDRLPKLSDLQIDLSKFEKSPDPGSLSSVFYTNKIDGIMLTVDSSGDVVESFSYFPEAKYDHLMCKNIRNGKPKPSVGCRSILRERDFAAAKEGGVWPYKDEKVDQAMIELGIKYYKAGCANKNK